MKILFKIHSKVNFEGYILLFYRNLFPVACKSDNKYNMDMKKCRECGKDISEQAFSCPGCGAPYPAKAKWDGWGYEYKSRSTFMGWPVLHISFKYRPNGIPVPAKGIIAIGQFGIGVINISQFGLGLFSLAQFTIAGYAITQFGAAYEMIAQFGLCIHKGVGQFIWKLSDLLG